MKTNKLALTTVFLVVLVDLIGFGIVLPLLPFYASKFGASAVLIGALYSIYSLAQLVFSPIWGGLSDRIGRRPIMLMSTLGSFFAYILFAYSNSLWLLLVSRLIAGVMGGNISTAQAYVADVTAPEDRAKGMGLIGAAFGIGFVAGPGLATLLIHPAFHEFFNRVGLVVLSDMIHQNKYAIPGLFAAMLSFLSFLLVAFKLPETVKNKGAVDSGRIVKTSLFTRGFWQSLSQQSQSSAKHILPLLMLSIFLISLGHSSLYSAFPLFCKKMLALSAENVGMLFVAMGLVTVLVQGGLIRPLEKRFGEQRLFLTGSVLMVTGLVLIPFAGSQGILILYLSIMAVGVSLNGPTLNSLISKEADPARIGAALGSSQGLSALGRVIGPTWGGLLFVFSVKLPFILTALLVTITVFIGIKLLKGQTLYG